MHTEWEQQFETWVAGDLSHQARLSKHSGIFLSGTLTGYTDSSSDSTKTTAWLKRINNYAFEGRVKVAIHPDLQKSAGRFAFTGEEVEVAGSLYVWKDPLLPDTSNSILAVLGIRRIPPKGFGPYDIKTV